MASASSSSAKFLYGDSKARINQKVRYTIDGIGLLSRNLVRSSKSSETLLQAAKVTSQQEHILESADLVNTVVTKNVRKCSISHKPPCKYFAELRLNYGT
jgi:hypothetical protein